MLLTSTFFDQTLFYTAFNLSLENKSRYEADQYN